MTSEPVWTLGWATRDVGPLPRMLAPWEARERCDTLNRILWGDDMRKWPKGAKPILRSQKALPNLPGNVSAMGSGGGLRDQLADLVSGGHCVGRPLPMNGRTFGPNQNVIKTGQTEDLRSSGTSGDTPPTQNLTE